LRDRTLFGSLFPDGHSSSRTGDRRPERSGFNSSCRVGEGNYPGGGGQRSYSRVNVVWLIEGGALLLNDVGRCGESGGRRCLCTASARRAIRAAAHMRHLSVLTPTNPIFVRDLTRLKCPFRVMSVDFDTSELRPLYPQ
jgi:hypothetical protein